MIGHAATARDFEYILEYVMLSKKHCLETFRAQGKNHAVLAVDAIKKRHLTSNYLVENTKPKRREAQNDRNNDRISNLRSKYDQILGNYRLLLCYDRMKK